MWPSGTSQTSAFSLSKPMRLEHYKCISLNHNNTTMRSKTAGLLKLSSQDDRHSRMNPKRSISPSQPICQNALMLQILTLLSSFATNIIEKSD